MQESFEKGQKYIMNTYNRFPIALEKGKGMHVFDDKGKKYLDFVAGIAVNTLGHGDEELVEAISEQAKNLIHCSNLYWTKPQVTLAEKLIKNSCFEKVFFCNSGAEAVEGTLKLIRKYGNRNGKNKTEIITMLQSFHGRTYGSVSATGQEKYQKDFKPLLPGIKHVEFNNFKALKNAVTENTGGILIEPIQGEGGILPADKEYLQKVRALCDEKDIVLVYDEIQCGIGRTGNLFAYEYYGVAPDAVTLAKGLAGGVPIGAFMVNEKMSQVLQPGDHASTFGGNPLATAAANVIIDRLLDKGLLENVKKQSKYLNEQLNKLKDRNNIIKDVRGVGLMQGIELDCPASDVINKCIDGGLLLVGAGANVIRFVPALIVSEKDIDSAMEILESAIKPFNK